MKVADLNDIELDYWMYRHACQTLEKIPSRQEFDAGYAKKQFHFSQDKALLADLVPLYQINLQQLMDEWLAFSDSASVYAKTPLEAALKLVLIKSYGSDLPLKD